MYGGQVRQETRERETKKKLWRETNDYLVWLSSFCFFFVWFAVRFRKLQLRLMSGGGLCSGCANSK